MSSYKENYFDDKKEECFDYEALINEMMGCKESKPIEKPCDDFKEHDHCKKEHSGDKDFDGCCKGPKPPKGQTKVYKKNEDIKGKDYCVENKNYYNNYYTRYNHYYVNNTNIYKDYVKDCNVYHFSTETIYDGCEYQGSSTVVKEDKDNGNDDKCKKHEKKSCCCRK